MNTFSGICANSGSALGPVFRINHSRLAVNRKVGAPCFELKLFENACDVAIKQLLSFCKQKEGDKDICDIFDTQRFILTDAALVKEVQSYIKAGAGAAAAVERAGIIFANNLRSINDNYFSERSTDVLDICNRVVKILDGETIFLNSPQTPSILVSEEIFPTDIACLKRSEILGMISSNGSENAHAAIIARCYSIPFIVMAGSEFLHLCEGKQAFISGENGKFHLYAPYASDYSSTVHCANYTYKTNTA